MTTLNYLLLPVIEPQRSKPLYTQLLEQQPVQDSETFVLFSLLSGLRVGLWAKTDMRPEAGAPGGMDIAFSEPNHDAVNRTYERWAELGLEIIQKPTEMAFGFTFTARDPDGHRLRVFTLNANPR